MHGNPTAPALPADEEREDAEVRENRRIMDLFWNRDERAIADCAARYGAYLMTVARNLLPSEEDAEECVSDAYLSAWNAIPPKRPDFLRLFLARLVRNSALDRLRALSAQKRIPSRMTEAIDELGEIVTGAENVEDAAENERLRCAINDWLRAQSPEIRSLFLERYFYGDEVKTIARRHDCTAAKVRSALARARTALKNHLEQEGFDL